ncbi:MAG TPA: hypothetical protein PK299_01875 [Anaerolineales bacterium]|nr:hypothetical protein [Anaerolineales bacterium]
MINHLLLGSLRIVPCVDRASGRLALCCAVLGLALAGWGCALTPATRPNATLAPNQPVTGTASAMATPFRFDGTPLIGITPRPSDPPFQDPQAGIAVSPLPMLNTPANVPAAPLLSVTGGKLELRNVVYVRAERDVNDPNKGNVVLLLEFRGGQAPYRIVLGEQLLFEDTPTRTNENPTDPTYLQEVGPIHWTCGAALVGTIVLFSADEQEPVGKEFYFTVDCQ